jgi:hypothetical protein
MIIYTPDGNIPKGHLKRSLQANADGWGYIFIGNDRKAIIRKGLDTPDFWSAWIKDNKARQGKPLLFHSRFMTHGLYDVSNCHPFRIGRRKLWVMHNGIIADHADVKAEKSDTRMFIKDILEELPGNWLENDPIRALVAGYIGDSKLAFMDGHGEVTIINEHLGIWDNKRWYSNSGYLPIAKAMGFTYPTYHDKKYGWDDGTSTPYPEDLPPDKYLEQEMAAEAAEEAATVLDHEPVRYEDVAEHGSYLPVKYRLKEIIHGKKVA